MHQAERTVDLDTLVIPFAIDDQERCVRAIDVTQSQRHKMRCPGCRDAVQWRRASRSGDKVTRIAHFAHKPGSSCKGTGWETMAHMELKFATVALIRASGVTRACGYPFPVTWKQEATPECPYPGTPYTADIGIAAAEGAGFLGLEIIKSSDMSPEKRRTVLSRGFYVATLNAKVFAQELDLQSNNHAWNVEQAARSYIIANGYRVIRMPLNRNVVPANIEVIGGTAVNCDRAADQVDPVSDNAIDRATALRVWHTRPELFPGHFDPDNLRQYLVTEVTV